MSPGHTLPCVFIQALLTTACDFKFSATGCGSAQTPESKLLSFKFFGYHIKLHADNIFTSGSNTKHLCMGRQVNISLRMSPKARDIKTPIIGSSFWTVCYGDIALKLYFVACTVSWGMMIILKTTMTKPVLSVNRVLREAVRIKERKDN